MIERLEKLKEVTIALENNPVVGVIGPRQTGKTTLAKKICQVFEKRWPIHYFDLEVLQDRKLLEDPTQSIASLKGLIVIDEIQHMPNLFMYLRVLADRTPLPAKFLVLGSASGQLMKQSAESLAGRIHYIELMGLGLREVGFETQTQLWLQGGYPRSYLATDVHQSFIWREQFIQTYLERDIPSLGIRVPSIELLRFWQMAAHYHGQIWNHSEIGRSLGVTAKTIQHYLDILTETFMVRQLSPWYENLGKRVVKSPKFYIRDSGLLHALLGIETEEELKRHPKLGSSWEGFALEQLLQVLNKHRNIFFWSVHSGGEIDLLIIHKGKKYGFEIKYSGSPSVTVSMKNAVDLLKLKKLFILYPGKKHYSIGETITLLPIQELQSLNWDDLSIR